MPPRTRPALARFLDKVQRLYPHGVPAALLRRAPRQEAALACAFVIVSSAGQLTREEQELLESIRSKALKLPAERCSVLVVPTEATLFSSGGAEQAAAVSIVFGASEPLGHLKEGPTGFIMPTHSLAAVQGDQAAKRAVWGHLKAVLPLLSEAQEA